MSNAYGKHLRRDLNIQRSFYLCTLKSKLFLKRAREVFTPFEMLV